MSFRRLAAHIEAALVEQCETSEEVQETLAAIRNPQQAQADQSARHLALLASVGDIG